MVAGSPGQGGAVWAVLQYWLGLRQLGHDVFLLEPIHRESVLPKGSALTSSQNAEYFRRLCDQFDLRGRAALLQTDSRQAYGADYAQLEMVADRADILLNLSGLLRDQNLSSRVGRRVYLDVDPGFTQLWQEAQGVDMGFDGHDRFVTVGTRIGRDGCAIPTCGRRWIPTLQPVVVDYWPRCPPPATGAYTTVGNWRGYGSIDWNGVHYGQKAHSLRNFLSLPSRVSVKLKLAMSIDPAEEPDLTALRANDWELVDPARLTSSPADYQDFIRSSRAELGIAKTGYVAASCGWFSDRSICYLATGRPVLAQETGFTGILPTGEGLIGFRDLDGIVEGIDAIESDYDRHSRRATEIAYEFFDSRKILTALIEKITGEGP